MDNANFMDDISDLLSSAENLLMEFDMSLEGNREDVINVTDDSFLVPSRAGQSRGASTPSSVRRRRRTTGQVPEVIDLCSPHPAPSNARSRKRPASSMASSSSAPVITVSEDDSTLSQDNSLAAGRLNCPICFGEMQDTVSTICGHLFCKGCLVQWLKTKKQCPLCKSGGAKIKFHPVYIMFNNC